MNADSEKERELDRIYKIAEEEVTKRRSNEAKETEPQMNADFEREGELDGIRIAKRRGREDIK